MEPKTIEFHEEKYTQWGVERTRLAHDAGAPFDGKPVLIKLSNGWCEAWWDEGFQHHDEAGGESEGFQWICMDDDFQAEFDAPSHWLPLPPEPNDTDGDDYADRAEQAARL